MKKILIVGMYDQLGGIESVVMNYYRLLYDKFEFGFVCMYDKIAYQDEIINLGGKIHYVTNVKKNPFKTKKELISLILAEKYDVVHVNMLSAANIVPLIAAKEANVKKIIAHSHNNNMPKSFLKHFLHICNKRKLSKYANIFLSCSDEAGNWMFDNKKFIVLKNSIDVSKFKYNYNESIKLKRKLSIPDDYIIYGHVGRFATQKNHDFLIDVFKNIYEKEKKSLLLLVGNGELKNKIIEKVNKLDLKDNVIFIDETSDVYKYYWIMDFFIFPSLFEGLGIVAVEAQAAGLQCFTSLNVPNDINLNESVIYLDIKDPLEFANNIINYRKKFDKDQMYGIVKNSDFNINVTANVLFDIYNN